MCMEEANAYRIRKCVDGIYEVKCIDKICCEIKRFYEKGSNVFAGKRIQHVEIRDNNNVLLSSTFDVETTIVPGLSRPILNSNDNQVAAILIGENYSDEIVVNVVNNNFILKVKSFNNQNFVFTNESNEVIASMEFDYSNDEGSLKISNLFLAKCESRMDMVECIVAAYPILKFSI